MRVFAPAFLRWKKAGLAVLAGGAGGLTLPMREADARERKAAPIEFAGAKPGEARAAPARVQPVAAAQGAPQLSFRYSDQPDVIYGYGAGGAPASPPIDLRPGPANDNAPVGTYVGRAFDARRVAADNDNAPLSATAAVTPVNAVRGEPAPTAPPQQRPAWLEQERVGAPYQAHDRWYVPTAEPGYSETGKASWYGAEFEGRKTASGEIYDSQALSAAHPTLPIPSLVQVTNLANGKEVILRVNDRGPFTQGRLIDVSRRAAEVLGFVQQGHAEVHVRYLGPAPKRVDSAPRTPAPAPSLAPATAPSGAPLIVTSAPQAPPSAQTGGAGQAYVVQIGAFSDFANAERARAALRTAGVVTIDTRQTERGAVHRVRLGPWGDRGAAESARSAAVARGYGDAVVSGLR